MKGGIYRSEIKMIIHKFSHSHTALFKSIFLYFSILMFSNNLHSQTLRFEQFTTKDDLPSDEIYNLHQDKKGYIWVFTNYGALKYNGRVFIPVLKNLVRSGRLSQKVLAFRNKKIIIQ